MIKIETSNEQDRFQVQLDPKTPQKPSPARSITNSGASFGTFQKLACNSWVPAGQPKPRVPNEPRPFGSTAIRGESLWLASCGLVVHVKQQPAKTTKKTKKKNWHNFPWYDKNISKTFNHFCTKKVTFFVRLPPAKRSATSLSGNGCGFAAPLPHKRQKVFRKVLVCFTLVLRGFLKHSSQIWTDLFLCCKDTTIWSIKLENSTKKL